MGRRVVSYGDPNERYHAGWYHWAGLCRWNAFRPVLLRSSGCDDHTVGHAGAIFLPCQGVHCVRVSGASLRREDAAIGWFPVSSLARTGCWCDHFGPRCCVGDRARMELGTDGGSDRCADHALHDVRWCPGRDLGRCQANGGHRGRCGDGCGPTLPGVAGGGCDRRGPSSSGGYWQTHDDRF